MSSERKPITLDYVEPSDVVKLVTKEEVKDYKIFDVRDEDEFSGKYINSAENHPSDNWKDYTYVKKVIEDNIGKDVVIFHCAKSQVRGPTCARIFADNLERYLLENPQDKVPDVRIMRGGFNAYSSENYGKEDLFGK